MGSFVENGKHVDDRAVLVVAALAASLAEVGVGALGPSSRSGRRVLDIRCAPAESPIGSSSFHDDAGVNAAGGL